MKTAELSNIIKISKYPLMPTHNCMLLISDLVPKNIFNDESALENRNGTADF